MFGITDLAYTKPFPGITELACIEPVPGSSEDTFL